MNRNRVLAVMMMVLGCWCALSQGGTVVFFNSTQVAANVSSDTNSDTISSNGYLFTCSRDKLFTGGVGMTEPIGRMVRVPWPVGVEAQAITVGPAIGSGARITIRRVDGKLFDLQAFTAKLLANTGGTGGSIEIMPILNGEDGFNDPLYFDASGYAGNLFSYNISPNYLGSTALLKGFEAYKIKLFVDYALTALTLQGPPRSDINEDGAVSTPDLIFIVEQWLAIPGSPSADIAPDIKNNFVNLPDFALLASEWLEGV